MQVEDLSCNRVAAQRHNHELLPKSIRGLIVGTSGCGKTTLLLNLLLQPDWLDYNKLYVYGKSLFQPEYQLLKSGFELGLSKSDLYTIFRNKDDIQSRGWKQEDVVDCAASQGPIFNIDPISVEFYEDGVDVMDPSELDGNEKNLMVFDDLMLEKQNKIEDYYVRGRHSNADCFYLAQNYFKLPRQTIRTNANLLCLFPMDGKDVDHIYKDHVKVDMDKQAFMDACKDAWSDKHGFLTIDKSKRRADGKYKKSLTTTYY